MVIPEAMLVLKAAATVHCLASGIVDASGIRLVSCAAGYALTTGRRTARALGASMPATGALVLRAHCIRCPWVTPWWTCISLYACCSWVERSTVRTWFACRYETGKKEGKYNEEEAKRERAKQSLERYMHYYQRFAENDKARKQVLHSNILSAVGDGSSLRYLFQPKVNGCAAGTTQTAARLCLQAILKMQEFGESKIEKLSELTATPTSQLKLVLEAWAQVISICFTRIWCRMYLVSPASQSVQPCVCCWWHLC
jgi:hypothetical protein